MDWIMALGGMGDALYPLIGATVLVVIGFFVALKGGSKFGWLIVVGAAVWAWHTVQPIIKEANQRSTPEQSQRGYYKQPGK